MNSKIVIAVVGISTFLVSGCISTPSAGKIPTLPNGDQARPDISAKYIEQGAWLDNGKKEKLDYPDFADQKCKERGFKRYIAYDAGFASTSSFAGLPSGDTARTIDIWCEK